MSTRTLITRTRTMLLTAAVAGASLLGVAATADAANFQVGIQSNNTLLDGSLTSEQRGANLDLLKAAGAQSVRVSMHWDWISTGACQAQDALALENHFNTCYSWGMYDDIVQGANARGLDVIMSVYGVPQWVLGNADPNYMGGSQAEFNRLVPQYAAFAKAATSRYAPGSALGTVGKWTVHNEPNSSYFWKPAPNPVRYAQLFRSAAQKMKEGNRSALVAAGPTGPYSPAYKPGRFLDVALKAMSKNGSGAYLNAWAHNPYPAQGAKSGPRRTKTKLPAIGISNVQDLVKIMDKYSATRRKPVWATELAYETSPQDRKKGVSFAQQAEYLAESLDVLESTGRVHVAIWYAYKDPTALSDWQSGFITAGGKVKPALAMFGRPVSRSASTIRRGARVQLWGASLLARGSQQLQMSANGKSGWKKVGGQRKDRNGSVTASVKGAKSFWVRTKDGKGAGPALKVTVR